ncbi:unnamed protein product [Prunus armeniaca]
MLVGRSSSIIKCRCQRLEKARKKATDTNTNDILQGFSCGTNLPELPITSQFRKYGPKMDTKKIVVITQIHKVHPNLWKPRSGLELMNNDLPSTNPEEAMSCFDLSKNDSSLISATGGMISTFDMTTFKFQLLFSTKSIKVDTDSTVIETLFIDHVCEWQDCLSLSLSTGNSLQVTYVLMRSLREQYLSMLQRAQVKSTVTDPGQSHMSTVAIPNGLPTTAALTLNEGSSPMSTDFHPIWQTILLC